MARKRNKLLIVDGYNVLRSGDRYRDIVAPQPDYADDYFNRARERLINDVVSFAGRDFKAVVVFDAGDNVYSTGASENIGGVRVMFSPGGSSADKVIEKLAHDARMRNIEVLVVSSDAAIQETVYGGGVTRMSANEFSYEMGAFLTEAKQEEQPKVSVKNTLAERLSPEQRAKLEALRDQ